MYTNRRRYDFEEDLDDIPTLLPDLSLEDDSYKLTDYGHYYTIVIFDLETTGLSTNDEICQIAASTLYDNQSFDTYILPSKPVTPMAYMKNGLRLSRRKLYFNNQRVRAFPAYKAFGDFLDYLHDLQDPVIMVAHNGFGFDVPRILALARKLDLLDEFMSVVKGFADSLQIIRTTLKERGYRRTIFNLQALAIDFLTNENINSLHNAVNDVEILVKILNELHIDDSIIIKNSKTAYKALRQEENCRIRREAKNSLHQYVGYIPLDIINRMSKAGISKQILQEAFNRCGCDGIYVLLTENVRGKPRVTKNKRILNDICDLFLQT